MKHLIDRMKLLFVKDKELHHKLKNFLGFYPHNIELYKEAFSHRSKQYRNNKGRSCNNERLEYLGDAILEAIVSDILYHKFTNKREGFLTNARSKVVKRTTLNKVAEEMGLMDLVELPKQTRNHRNNISGNVFEAFIGAIYLDQGYPTCKTFVEKHILDHYINLEAVVKREENFKSKLLEWSQKNKLNIQFRLKTKKNKANPENEGKAKVSTEDIIFRTLVFIEKIYAGEGEGNTKKESQQRAAKNALEKMNNDKKLKDKIYAAKEDRTKMEAPQYAALPKAEEEQPSLIITKDLKEAQ